MKFGMGQSVRRVEDIRFTQGQGRYVDDFAPDRVAHGIVVRSPVAHARIVSVDVDAARDMPGVLAVYTGQDWLATGLGPIPIRQSIEQSDGSPVVVPDRWPLAVDKVTHVGDQVAFVVAETRRQAQDAADLIDVEYDEIDAVVDPYEALAEGTLQIHDTAPGNLCFRWDVGQADPVDQALAAARHVVSLQLENNRLVITPMEPRGALAQYDPADESFILTGAVQYVFMFQELLADKVFRIPREKLRVVAPDVGGGFGGKNQVQPEHALVMHAARELGRPVKWVSTRQEAFLTDGQGRDQNTLVQLALDEDLRFTALKIETVANIGGWVSTNGPVVPTVATASVMGGAYDIPAVYYDVRAAFTNTVPTDAYRGAGRPEACYLLERVVEKAARELGVDALELRRRNFIRPEQLPYQASLGHLIDSGRFEELMDRAIAASDLDGFAARKADSEKRGKIRGFGIAPYLEATLGAPVEHAGLEFHEDGSITLSMGTQSNGQSHETTFAQIVHDKLGVDFDQIKFRQSDTAATPIGHGHGGSRSTQVGGSAVLGASDRVIEKAKNLASELLETAVEDIEFRDGQFTVTGTDRHTGWCDIIAAAFDTSRPEAERGLSGEEEYTKAGMAFPNGCHTTEIEIDPETGVIDVVKYTALDDFGNIINPMVVRGQVMGGIVQGLGQAVMEHTVFDQDGQLLSGSLMDYSLPRADNLPETEIDFFEDAPTETSPMGVKGCGEAGTIAGPPAIASALCNALDVDHIDMPFTADKIWRLIHGR